MTENFTQILIVYVLYVTSFCDCKMKPFIVGGQYAKIDDFPYSVFFSIECVTDEGTVKWICGGSILNQYLTLTAAHCLAHCSPRSYITVFFGNENLLNGHTTTTYSFATHKRYCEHTGFSDIALARLKTELVFDSTVSRVVLMPQPPYREEAVVAGWGVINVSNSIEFFTIILSEYNQATKRSK